MTDVDVDVEPQVAPPFEGLFVDTRAALATTDTSWKGAYLLETGRQGVFYWNSANLSAPVAADTTQALYVPPTGQNGSTGAWVRTVESGKINAKWFGAVGDRRSDSAALNAFLSYLKAQGGHGFIPPGFYRCNELVIDGGSVPLTVEWSPDAWLELDTADAHVFSLNNRTIGTTLIGPNVDARCRTGGLANSSHPFNIYSCSNVRVEGTTRVRDWGDGANAVIVYMDLVGHVPGDYANVIFDDVEMIASERPAGSGMLFANMYHSGVNGHVYAEGILNPVPGIAIQFKSNCFDCWYGSYTVRNCYLAIAAAGTEVYPAAENCRFGPGLMDQVHRALHLNDCKMITVAPFLATPHPNRIDDPVLDRFIRISPTTDCVVEGISVQKYRVDHQPLLWLGDGSDNFVRLNYVHGVNAAGADAVLTKLVQLDVGDRNTIIVENDASRVSAPLSTDLATYFSDGGTDNQWFYEGPNGTIYRQGATIGWRYAGGFLLPLVAGGSHFGSPTVPWGRIAANTICPGKTNYTGLADGFAQTLGASNVHNFIFSGTIAAGRINMPSSPQPGQYTTILSTHAITALDHRPSGSQTLLGKLTTIAANGHATWVYDDSTTTWYRAE